MNKLCFENYVREIYETLETLNLGNQDYFEHLNEEERARLEEIKKQGKECKKQKHVLHWFSTNKTLTYDKKQQKAIFFSCECFGNSKIVSTFASANEK